MWFRLSVCAWTLTEGTPTSPMRPLHRSLLRLWLCLHIQRLQSFLLFNARFEACFRPREARLPSSSSFCDCLVGSFFRPKLTHRLGRRLLRAWMFWQVQCLLWDTPAQPDAMAVPLPLDVRSQDTVEACWVQLTKRMRAWFLDRYARQHACPLCLRFATVGVDNKVNLATRVCGYAEGGVRQYPTTHVSVSFGCTLPPRPRSAYCAQHATCFTADPVASDVPPRCCNGHDLQLSSVNSETYIFTCDVCSATLAQGSLFWTCGHGCEYDLCPECVTGAGSLTSAALPPAAPAACSSQEAASSGSSQSEFFWDVCGLSKPAPSPGCRRSGGVLTLVLACGTVCHVSPCAGHESATQIYGLLGEVRARRSFDFVIYDNACMLSRFVANSFRASRAPGEAVQHLRGVTYVLDRFHERNRRACLDPQHALCNPTVRVAAHPALAGVNSSQNEQWNAWAGKFAHVLRFLRFDAMELYLLLVAHLWNTHVVPSRRDPSPSPAPASVQTVGVPDRTAFRHTSLLRRRRPRSLSPGRLD